MFKSDAKWIWLMKREEPNEYASFFESYVYNGGDVTLRIASESNYIAYVNDKRVAFGQFPGFRDEKYYDEINLTDYSCFGVNTLRIVVRYEGLNTFTHIKDKAGVIFEITCEGCTLCYSSEVTLGGLDANYQQHIRRLVTPQIGYSSDMCSGGDVAYKPCREVELSQNLLKRPVEKLTEESFVYAKKAEIQGKEIYDLGQETAGYIFLDVDCTEDCNIIVIWGEHISDGCVRQRIGERDFSMNFQCRSGNNYFEQLFLRAAGRYIEVFKPESAHVSGVGMLPVLYPIEEKDRFLTGLEGRIYDTSVRTLKLCMHEHYEDCPWREQALYALDSRNQMLCGYYAFKGTAFARANIVFMSKGIRKDGLLELTYPAVNTPVIPFFTIIYPVIVWEYIRHTNDRTILNEVMPVVKNIMKSFRDMIGQDYLIHNLPKPYWNFYEWSDGSDGSSPQDSETTTCDLILNCAFIYAGDRYCDLCNICGETFDAPFEKLRNAIKTTFYDRDKGIYFASNKCRGLYTQLGNAFVKLIGLGGTNLDKAVKGECGVVSATLSMKAFIYDALLEDQEKNKAFILEDIKRNYSYMLSRNATSFWETINGEADFDNAGSLCHGWSAIPIYYYSKLLK